MGQVVGRIDEGTSFYPVVVRLPEQQLSNPDGLRALPFRTLERQVLVPLGQVVTFETEPQFATIFQEATERRRAVLITLQGRDPASYAAELERAIDDQVRIPAGVRVAVSGRSQQLHDTSLRLAGLCFLIFGALYLLTQAVTGSWRITTIVFAKLPFALIGGVLALSLRGMPFTISAGIGLIALAGLAMINGLVLARRFITLIREQVPAAEAAFEAAVSRLRPVLMTALAAGVGLIPLAFSVGPGAEVQRPLATVQLGGMISSY
jgi:cobalt-zinc-cadmium resistance protein CzcA